MNDDVNQQILNELRKTRQLNQIMCWFSVVLIIAAIVFIAFEHKRMENAAQSKRTQEYPWSKVDTAWYQLDYPKALSLAQNILLQDTNDAWGYDYLGSIYFRIGDITNAEAAYKRSYQLYPSKTFADDLDVAQKRLAMEHGK